LLEGEYPAGTTLSVEAIRTEFDVSKQPVMEALRLLSADGLVEILRQIGCGVTEYSLEEVEDFFRMLAGSNPSSQLPRPNGVQTSSWTNSI
jgi:DNA-binding GntR family transcriptional regulator